MNFIFNFKLREFLFVCLNLNLKDNFFCNKMIFIYYFLEKTKLL